jgi:ribosomal-protein-alanine N-acetyltransferase
MIARVLTAQDAEAMAAIHATCFDRPWPALDMAVHVTRDLCLGVGEPLTSFTILRRSDIDAEILTVATDPAARGQGLAGQVLKAAAAQYRVAGLRHIFLEVAEDNTPAQALWTSRGDYLFARFKASELKTHRSIAGRRPFARLRCVYAKY